MNTVSQLADLPASIRKDVAVFARKLAQNHGAAFRADRTYRKRAGQFLTALLPPKPRRRGRPGRSDVTEAIRLLNQYRRRFPTERAAEHWARIYAIVIPGYGEMNRVEQRDACQRLTERVRWRSRARNRPNPTTRIGSSPTDCAQG